MISGRNKSNSRLRLNPMKTEMVWLGASRQVSRINNSDISMLSTTIKVAQSARDLGVILDAEFCHVTREHLTSATNIFKTLLKTLYAYLTRPQRFVTFYISALEILLLTYFAYLILSCWGR